MDGFYAAYFTGVNGNSMGLFVFRDGTITGVDVGGLHYDGSFTVDAAKSILNGKIVYTIPPGVQLITGEGGGTEHQRLEFPIQLPLGFADGRVLAIPTPGGLVNARFEKVRDWK